MPCSLRFFELARGQPVYASSSELGTQTPLHIADGPGMNDSPNPGLSAREDVRVADRVRFLTVVFVGTVPAQGCE